VTDVSLDTEWLDGDQISGAELSATFASLRIDVCGQLVTDVVDRRARTVRDSVYVPLYPLAEWLVSNWWFLAYEFENPARNEDPHFFRRHALGASTEGYALPNLLVTSSGARTQLAWGGGSSSWTKVDFLRKGWAIVDRADFLAACADLIERVIRRLVAFDIHNTLLQEEWSAIQAADGDESRFCEIAAGLGWDPYDLTRERQQQVLRVAEELGELRGEAVPIMDTSNPLRDVSLILSAVQTARPNSLHLQSLRPLAEKVESGSLHGNPWDLGYELAQKTRQALNLDGQPIPSVSALAEALNEDSSALKRVFHPLESLTSLGLIDGVVAGGKQGSVSIGLRGAGDYGRRFIFCRALAEAITSDADALVTRGRTERQQRNRAFAAEFLAPSSSLKQRISQSFVDGEEVVDLAEEYGVSTQVIAHQIENHEIARLAGAL